MRDHEQGNGGLPRNPFSVKNPVKDWSRGDGMVFTDSSCFVPTPVVPIDGQAIYPQVNVVMVLENSATADTSETQIGTVQRTMLSVRRCEPGSAVG